jgi:hypothetical protein
MILGITALFLFSKKSRAPESLLHSLSVHLGGVALLSVFIIVNTLFDIRLDNGLVLTGGELELFAQDENAYPMELDGFWIKGKSKATVIVKTAEPAASFTLTAYSPVEGKTTIRLAAENKRAERNERTGLEQSIMFSSPRGFSWKGNHLYRLEIKEDSGFYPSRINPGSRDSRFLGVFIRIEASLLRSHSE